MTVTLYQVGGSVRDELLGLKSKDIDFAVETGSFAELRDWLVRNEFDVFLEQEEYLTIRARFPREGFSFAGQNMGGVTADFVVCRTEAHYSDQRRPDSVDIGTIRDDLARRDFTMNAIAKRADGTLLDPYFGQDDLDAGVIRAVGRAQDRFEEDPLRMLRAVRFMITKGFEVSLEIWDLLYDEALLSALKKSVSVERIREELHKMLKHNTHLTMQFLFTEQQQLARVLFNETNIWLKPTLEAK